MKRYLVPLIVFAMLAAILGAWVTSLLRMTALGFPVFQYRLVAFTLSGTFGGLAGILLANEGAYISPAMMSAKPASTVSGRRSSTITFQ